MDNEKLIQNTTAFGHYLRVVAFAVMGIFIGALLTFTINPGVSEAPTDTSVYEFGTDATTTRAALPTRLIIPSAGIDTTFEEPLGLNDDQTIEVPDSFEEVGWYQFAPRPGEMGPAVILGHVDSYQGPAVFFRLGSTKPGDIVSVERADGTVADFEVTELVRRPQSDFPTEAVYGDIDHAGLRLITCTGTYDHGKQVYSHNLIVFAKLVGERPVTETAEE